MQQRRRQEHKEKVDMPKNHAQETGVYEYEYEHDLMTEQSQRRIYPVTDGLQSPYTKATYKVAFDHFLEQTAHTRDLQVLLDYSPKVIESLIIEHVIHLRDVHQVHCAAIFHFFEMNDVSTLNTKKIKRFFLPDGYSPTDRAYTHAEIEKILLNCDNCSRVIVSAHGIDRYENRRYPHATDWRKCKPFIIEGNAKHSL
jgi:hypothetical protein